jgi:hypothetical protein
LPLGGIDGSAAVEAASERDVAHWSSHSDETINALVPVIERETVTETGFSSHSANGSLTS